MMYNTYRSFSAKEIIHERCTASFDDPRNFMTPFISSVNKLTLTLPSESSFRCSFQFSKFGFRYYTPATLFSFVDYT